MTTNNLLLLWQLFDIKLFQVYHGLVQLFELLKFWTFLLWGRLSLSRWLVRLVWRLVSIAACIKILSVDLLSDALVLTDKQLLEFVSSRSVTPLYELLCKFLITEALQRLREARACQARIRWVCHRKNILVAATRLYYLATRANLFLVSAWTIVSKHIWHTFHSSWS